MNLKKLTGNQEGYSSIVVTLIIMAILILITAGLVRLIGWEQRQTIDRQLSTQAYYAAEAGINEAIETITDLPNPLDKTDCRVDTADHAYDYDMGDAGDSVEYTCLLVDNAPRTLVYDSVKMSSTTTFPISSIDPSTNNPVNPTHLRISWQNESVSVAGGFPPAGQTDLPTAASWPHQAGVLRISLTPLNGGFSRQALVTNTFTAFMYPNAAGADSAPEHTFSTGPAEQGSILRGDCNTANNGTTQPFYRFCNAVIVLPGTASDYLVTVRSYYSNASVVFSAHQGAASNPPLRLSQAQSLIDSTGRAGDVLRRIQVRVPRANSYAYPAFALDAGSDICKQYTIAPSAIGNPGGCAVGGTP